MEKKIFSLKVANQLINRGHKIIRYEVNTMNPKYKVFVFLKTNNFKNDLDNILSCM